MPRERFVRERAAAPQALHLIRLAQGSPGQWLGLPGGDLRVLNLSGKHSGNQPGSDAVTGWLLCLSGEAVVDLPLNNFVRLRPGEGYRVTAGEPWTAFGTKDGSVLLFSADAG
ncbi:hypothetical protein GCM10010840_20970 [Deinococcus aerolatus]|uniref:Cupin n=1 Tax=Deinococcus aerolatus TaxID=522487 RepID=A0ABQ2GAD1_9DEIO|nr:hypothetical protein [Deinococcus aerolatus]GGL82993.1 hypothetical protein GCM10010840_20970 [Deinococcus aerolatus]